ARNYAGYSYGRVFGDTEISAKAFWGEAQRSDGRYKDFAGASYNMNRASDLRPRSLNLQASGRDAYFKLLVDDYSLRYRDGIDGAVLSTGSGKVAFPAIFAEFGHTVYLPGEIRLEPKLNYSRSMAWLEKDPYFAYDKKTQRVTATVTGFRHFGAATEIMAGGEYFNDRVKVDEITAPGSKYSNLREQAIYDNYAFFGQAGINSGIANFVAGARYDKHSHYGSSLVPRFAATKLIDDFNFKAIYSRAFRAPGIENIRLAGDNGINIRPEITTTVEGEAGYKAGDTVYLYGNAAATNIEHPIVFSSVGGTEGYRNYPQTGTTSYGAGLKYKDGAVMASLAYLTYSAKANRVDVYSVPAHGSYLLGFPRHKIVANAAVPLAAGLSVNPSAIYISRRYGFGAGGAVKPFGEKVIAGVNLQLRDRPLQRLTLNLGVKDIFNSRYAYLQPYDGGHAPLPASSREIFLKADYEF
ncbi:MAG: TonB-dependent receptor, partial [Elusimicrobia bacterium]|nr:TonB-dependent receptor [Elusimicrobiota bacterium]